MSWITKNPDSILSVKGGLAIHFAAVLSLLLLFDVLRGKDLIGAMVFVETVICFALITYYIWHEIDRCFSKGARLKKKVLLVLVTLSGIIISPLNIVIAPIIGAVFLFSIFSFYKLRRAEQKNKSAPPFQNDKIIDCHKLAAITVIALSISQTAFLNIVAAHADKIASSYNQKMTP